MRLVTRIVSVIAASLAVQAAGGAPPDTDRRTFTHRIDAESLGEQREIYLRVPPGYDDELRYPVVYVLDGEWGFDLVASYLDYYAREGLYPPVIVTAVRNVNRNRDYVPAVDARFPYTGGAEAFVDFVATEWREYVEARYASSDERILLGHSFGGTFVLHALFTRPELFDAYIALSASTWVADRVLFDEARRYFDRERHPRAFLYMAVGQADGGPTVPDGEALAGLFDEHAPANLEWYFEIQPRAEHFINFTSGLHDGFQRLFPRWQFESELVDAAHAGGGAAVARWFAAQRAALGYRFQPSWFDIGVAALRLSAEGHHDAAVRIIEELQPWFGEHPHLLSMGAGVYRKAGAHARAEAALEKAIAIALATGEHPNAIQVPRLERQLERVRKELAESAPSAPDD